MFCLSIIFAADVDWVLNVASSPPPPPTAPPPSLSPPLHKLHIPPTHPTPLRNILAMKRWKARFFNTITPVIDYHVDGPSAQSSCIFYHLFSLTPPSRRGGLCHSSSHPSPLGLLTLTAVRVGNYRSVVHRVVDSGYPLVACACAAWLVGCGGTVLKSSRSNLKGFYHSWSDLYGVYSRIVSISVHSCCTRGELTVRPPPPPPPIYRYIFY